MRDFSSRTFARRRWTEPAETASDEFRKQVLPHLDAAYNLARFFTRDATLSEDVVQDAPIADIPDFEEIPPRRGYWRSYATVAGPLCPPRNPWLA